MVAVVVYLLGVAFIVCIMRGVDTEKLIKNIVQVLNDINSLN